jgi:hypothetical protein
MTYGTHLRRSRHGTLYFRLVVPSDLRGSVGKSEFSISLGTASKRSAELAALELQLAAKRFIECAREAIRMNDRGARTANLRRASSDRWCGGPQAGHPEQVPLI